MKMEKPEGKIGNIAGYELSLKIKEILLGKFRAKKKFLSSPSIENSSLKEMTDFIFYRITTELDPENSGKDFNEIYKQRFDLNISLGELTKKVWEIVASINKYKEVSSGNLSGYAYNIFETTPKDLKTLDKRLRDKVRDAERNALRISSQTDKKLTPSENNTEETGRKKFWWEEDK